MKYVPGLMVGQLSGSAGSTVASHNRYGSYFRNRTVPVNPATPSQTTARALLTGFSQAWKTLTASQRSGWQQLADLDPIADSQSQSVILAANAYYVRFNTIRNTVGLARLDDAPGAVELPPSLSNISLVLDGTGGAMNSQVTVGGGTATNFVAARLTASTSPGVNFFGRSAFRNVNVIAGNAIALPTMAHLAEYEAIFGASWRTKVGEKITAELFPVSDSGFTGSPIQTQGIII